MKCDHCSTILSFNGRRSEVNRDFGRSMELMNMKMNLEIDCRFEETRIGTETIHGVHLTWMLENGFLGSNMLKVKF